MTFICDQRFITYWKRQKVHSFEYFVLLLLEKSEKKSQQKKTEKAKKQKKLWQLFHFIMFLEGHEYLLEVGLKFFEISLLV